MTIKRLRITPRGVVPQAENPAYPDIKVPASRPEHLGCSDPVFAP